MKQDVNYKVSTILNNVKKNQRQILTDENKHIRQLDKIEHMQKSLAEDFSFQKETLSASDTLKERTNANFEVIDKEN